LHYIIETLRELHQNHSNLKVCTFASKVSIGITSHFPLFKENATLLLCMVVDPRLKASFLNEHQVQNLKIAMKNEIIKYQLPLEPININTNPEVNTDENDMWSMVGEWSTETLPQTNNENNDLIIEKKIDNYIHNPKEPKSIIIVLLFITIIIIV